MKSRASGSDVQRRLREWAGRVALPYVLAEEKLSPRAVSLVLVGSAAAGGCREDSDVDLAILCRDGLYRTLAKGKPWERGRPTEVILDGQQLHYFAASVPAVRQSLEALDDHAHYMYGTAVPLLDRAGHFARHVAPLAGSAAFHRARLEGRLDMLLRRLTALEACASEGEPLMLARISLEVVTLAVKTAALIDGTAFDTRKRFMQMALSGPLGRRLEPGIVAALRSASAWQAGKPNRPFLNEMKRVRLRLSAAAQKAGYAVGLPKPDHRAGE